MYVMIHHLKVMDVFSWFLTWRVFFVKPTGKIRTFLPHWLDDHGGSRPSLHDGKVWGRIPPFGNRKLMDSKSTLKAGDMFVAKNVMFSLVFPKKWLEKRIRNGSLLSGGFSRDGNAKKRNQFNPSIFHYRDPCIFSGQFFHLAQRLHRRTTQVYDGHGWMHLGRQGESIDVWSDFARSVSV